jgi:D-alanyl-lipoteichoic acid acyltransferase DltB (MBOAT superfamily)
MLFNSPLYAFFLVGTWGVFACLRHRHRARSAFLVVASYLFYLYGSWEAARDEAVPLPPFAWALLCLGIIFVGSTLDYWIGRALGSVTRPAHRKALLLASLVYYLGVLGLFKYWNFAADSLVAILAAVGVSVQPAHVRLVLPFGISFFTFETMSYTIDVWRGELRPANRYLDYLLFVCFFPHLVAGPIVRPAQMLPQLASAPTVDAEAQARGLWRIATGLVKKIVIGDYLAQAIVDRAFDAPERFTRLEMILAVYAYAAQIYADFSGYTDVAIGSAALFGYVLPENFDAPYVARNLQDFWRRWHISLSAWLRDYLYKPLGGSRGGVGKTYRNLMITMVLGGLWHGASWNFVLWGGLHGAALVAARATAGWRGVGDRKPSRLGEVVAVLATFHFVCFAWIFFRAGTLDRALLVIERLGSGSMGLDHIASRVVWVLAAAAAMHLCPRRWKVALTGALGRTPALVQGVLLAAVAVGLHLVSGARAEPFVYGQF